MPVGNPSGFCHFSSMKALEPLKEAPSPGFVSSGAAKEMLGVGVASGVGVALGVGVAVGGRGVGGGGV